MSEWNAGGSNPRADAASRLVASLDQNDAEYLAETIGRDKWLETAKEIDSKLAVIGLRLLVRPWAPQAGR